MSDLQRRVLGRAEKWAEQCAANARTMSQRMDRLAQEIHEAAAAGDAKKVFRLQAEIVHCATWGLARLNLDTPASYAETLIGNPTP